MSNLQLRWGTKGPRRDTKRFYQERRRSVDGRRGLQTVPVHGDLHVGVIMLRDYEDRFADGRWLADAHNDSLPPPGATAVPGADRLHQGLSQRCPPCLRRPDNSCDTGELCPRLVDSGGLRPNAHRISRQRVCARRNGAERNTATPRDRRKPSVDRLSRLWFQQRHLAEGINGGRRCPGR